MDVLDEQHQRALRREPLDEGDDGIVQLLYVGAGGGASSRYLGPVTVVVGAGGASVVGAVAVATRRVGPPAAQALAAIALAGYAAFGWHWLQALGLAGQGLRDVIRIAASDPGLWTQILAGNAHEVRDVLQHVRADLDAIAAALGETSSAR